MTTVNSSENLLSVPTNPILLIDADLNVYKILTINEKEFEFDEDQWTITQDLVVAKRMLAEQFDRLILGTKASETFLCISGQSNWRKEIYPEYKANRKQRPPIGIQPIRQWLRDTYEVVERTSLEADDCIGIMATRPDFAERCVIVSVDKDLNQIPGWHYDADSGQYRLVSVAQGDRFHLFQTLVGDVADNYPGAVGIGPVRANRILDSEAGWAGIVKAFNGDEQAAITQARIARIVRWQDWDEALKRVIPWNPPITINPNPVSNEAEPSVSPVETLSSPNGDTTSLAVNAEISLSTEGVITSDTSGSVESPKMPSS